MKNIYLSLLLTTASLPCFAQDPAPPDDDLARKIQNPVANLISVPFQDNIDSGSGLGIYKNVRNTLNIQPVYPVTFGKLLLINRLIIPIMTVPSTTVAGNWLNGLGDITYTALFAPASQGKLIYGGGVALGIPTATSPELGTGKLSAGPSVLALYQDKGWTIGGLAQNTWSVAGDANRSDVNFFYSQIFLVRTLKNGWYVNSTPIITANWIGSKADTWTVPVGGGGGKLVKFGKFPLNMSAQAYANVSKPTYGPDWTIRLQVVMLFPK